MEVTKEVLEGTLRKLVTEPEFKGYSFNLQKDWLSRNDSGINNPHYIEAIREEDTPWNVYVRRNEDIQKVFTTFEIEARNSMKEAEFDDYVKRKASGAIQMRRES
jgi:hypothetical protein